MAHPELDELFNTLVPFAKTMLREYGEFYPFGAFMSSSGEIQWVGAKMEDDDHPPSESLIDLLTETFKNQAARGGLRAAAICYDVLTVPPGEDRKRDAICCGLSIIRENGGRVRPLRQGSRRDVQYGEVFAANEQRNFS